MVIFSSSNKILYAGFLISASVCNAVEARSFNTYVQGTESQPEIRYCGSADTAKFSSSYIIENSNHAFRGAAPAGSILDPNSAWKFSIPGLQSPENQESQRETKTIPRTSMPSYTYRRGETHETESLRAKLRAAEVKITALEGIKYREQSLNDELTREQKAYLVEISQLQKNLDTTRTEMGAQIDELRKRNHALQEQLATQGDVLRRAAQVIVENDSLKAANKKLDESVKKSVELEEENAELRGKHETWSKEAKKSAVEIARLRKVIEEMKNEPEPESPPAGPKTSAQTARKALGVRTSCDVNKGNLTVPLVEEDQY